MWNKIKQKPLLYTFVKALVTAIVILAIVLIWLRFYTNHGEKIETPNFIGLTVENAQKLAEENDLRITIDSVFSSRPKNTVILQSPIFHTDSTESWVKNNRKIYLTVVKNSRQLVEIPDLLNAGGKSAVASKLAILGLNVKWTAQASPYKNAVLDVKFKGKKIRKGKKIPKGSVIEVFYGKGSQGGLQISLPNFVGMTINQANLELGGKQLTLNPVYMGDFPTKSDTNNAVITQQDPAFTEGKTVTEGSEVMVIF